MTRWKNGVQADMTDYIDREETVKTVRLFNALTDDEKEWEIRRIPSADVAPVRHGHWIYDRCDIVCSECGTAFSDEVCYMMQSDTSYHEPRHCLWCGARMDKDGDD